MIVYWIAMLADVFFALKGNPSCCFFEAKGEFERKPLVCFETGVILKFFDTRIVYINYQNHGACGTVLEILH